MNQPRVPAPVKPRLISAVLAAVLTLAVLGGIDALAHHEAGTPLMAHKASAPSA